MNKKLISKMTQDEIKGAVKQKYDKVAKEQRLLLTFR